MLKLAHLARTDLNLLVLFQVVLDECHVGRAANRLNLTPSAVSHGLGRLRKLLNDPLFLRSPKGVVPTARALTLREPVAEILARVLKCSEIGGAIRSRNDRAPLCCRRTRCGLGVDDDPPIGADRRQGASRRHRPHPRHAAAARWIKGSALGRMPDDAREPRD